VTTWDEYIREMEQDLADVEKALSRSNPAKCGSASALALIRGLI